MQCILHTKHPPGTCRYYTVPAPALYRYRRRHIISPALSIYGRFILRQPISRQKTRPKIHTTTAQQQTAGERPRVLHAAPCLVAQHHAAAQPPPPCMPALPHGPLQLAQRTVNAGAITRHMTGQCHRTLSPVRGHPGLM
jgi:hypothetical protein